MPRRALVASIGLILTLVVSACQNADADGAKGASPGPSGDAPPASSGPPAPPSAPPQSAPQPVPSASGLPPLPDDETRAKYVAALDAVDPRIVGGDVPGAVERGRATCQSIAANMNHAKLITQTRQKFARTGYPVGVAQAEAIVRIANTHLCPSYGA